MKKLNLLRTMITLLFCVQTAHSAVVEVKTDNTQVSQKDCSTDEKTSNQQPNFIPDAEISRRIRQDLMANNNLSTHGQNVEVVTINGQVTLIGTALSETEKNTIIKCARAVDGVTQVVSRIDVVPK